MKTFTEQLETMVDNATLSTVLDTLADICVAKADHLASNWQDASAAKDWTRAARRIETAREAIARVGL